MFKIKYPEELPVSKQRQEIALALANHQVIIVAGETGSGKTTQLPKIALELGRQSIAHTQPRRIAARSVAERIAQELETELGDLVGYQVRFTDRVSKDSKIRLMTDGILLAQTHRDRDLKLYDTIIIDEAHERSLNIDFLLGYLKRLLPRRPDLKVIITSATIDPESFAAHFADAQGRPAPIIEVSGRTYPVDIEYQPLDGRDLVSGVVDAVTSLPRGRDGDALVFLSGEAEIKDTAEALSGLAGDRFEVLPLYGRLSAHEQHRVFSKAPSIKKRVILATNVAETSLTVPGIKYVIDSGFARISRWSVRSKVQRLPIEAISQASANQRSGRAGRLSAGIAIRLYSEDDFLARPEFTEPEILRTGLAGVILQMLSLGLGNIANFPFLTPPDKRGISTGLQLLSELGAVKEQRITKTGRALAKLPIEPRFGRMILESLKQGTLYETVVIVAGLTVQDVRERPEEERAQADQLHARFKDPQGDLIALLNLWKHLTKRREELTGNAFRRLCRAEFLNYMRVREWSDLVNQLLRASQSVGAPKTVEREIKASHEAIHRSVLAGLLSHLGVRDDTKVTTGRRQSVEFIGSRGRRFVIHPGSFLAKKPPELIMSVELVETSRLFARSNAVVDPVWAEDIAKDFLKRSLSEPHWQKSRGQATAFERLTLFGIPIVEKRTVALARFDQELARSIFIRSALVEGDWNGNHAFDRANWQLRRELEAIEARHRRRDLVADDEVIYDFYDSRIPEQVTSQIDFDSWWKKVSKKSPKLLHLKKEDLLEDEVDAHEEFPRVWSFGDQSLKLKYRFDPTSKDDGVNVLVPLPLLPRIEQTSVAELVPGLRVEYVEALIRSLPKAIRKHVVPAPEWAKKFLHEVGSDLEASSLTKALARFIRLATSQIVEETDFDVSRLPNHLRPTYSVIDSRGKKIASGKEVASLQKKYQGLAQKDVSRVAQGSKIAQGSKPAQSSNAAEVRSTIERIGITEWDFDDIPKIIETRYAARSGTGLVKAYPALKDQRKHVDLILTPEPHTQKNVHIKGLTRLLFLSAPNTSSYVKEHLTNEEKLLIASGPFRSLDHAINETLLFLARKTVADKPIFTRQEFEQLASSYALGTVNAIYETIATLVTIMREAKRARASIDTATSLNTISQAGDAKQQFKNLIFEGFLSQIDPLYLDRLPVYLKALSIRMEKLQSRAGKDRALQNEIEDVTRVYESKGGKFPPATDSSQELIEARWLIEEYRVSLFAQELGTAQKVSRKRILDFLT